MNNPGLLRIGWARVREYLPAVMAAALMFGGIKYSISVLSYLLSGGVIGLINFTIRHGFRDAMVMGNPYGDAASKLWMSSLRDALEGVFVWAMGALLAVWAHARRQSKTIS